MRLLLAVLAAALAGQTPAPAAAGTLTSGFFDDLYLDAGAGSWFARTANAGATSVRIPVSWRAIAPGRRPAGFDPSNPDSPGYGWDVVDRAVARAHEHGLSVLLSIDHAPDWAEGAHRRAGIPDGAWRPSPTAFAQFLTAAARHYGAQVAAWQLWNEPNLETYLAPQLVRRGGDQVNVGPDLYRALVNAGAGAIRAVLPSAVVVTGGTAPFGDYPIIRRTPPVDFVRRMLCLDERLRQTCDTRVDFDVLAHHPYSTGGPRQSARNSADVSVPNLGRLKRLLRAAARHGTVTGRKRLWVTEFSYDSKPPDPRGVPEATRARWIGEAFYEFWRQGVDHVYWYRLRDQAVGDSYAASYQSGAYFHSGRAKPSLRAFRLPFAAFRAGRSGARYWGRTSRAGTVAVQVRRSGGWRTVRRVEAAAFLPFGGTLRAPGRTRLRIAFGGLTSQPVTLR